MEYFYNSKYKVIYLMRIPYSTHQGLIKVGDTTVDLPLPNLPPNSSINGSDNTRRQQGLILNCCIQNSLSM